MRDYAKVSPQFWIGPTGKLLRAAGRDAQLVALYLLTNPHANMLGLYYLPKLLLSHETGLSIEGASKGLARCHEAHFCSFDAKTEMVWVHEMAAYQVGEQLTANDKRCIGIQNEYDSLPENPFLQGFFDRYRTAFHLKNSREFQPKTASPSEAPSEPHRSQEHEQEQEQEEEQNYVEQARPNGGSEDGPEAMHRVFEHWRQVHQHPKAKLDPKRRRVICAALKSYTEADLCEAISGYRNSPHHMGENDRRAVYDDIELLLRDAKHIEAGLRFAKASPPSRGIVV